METVERTRLSLPSGEFYLPAWWLATDGLPYDSSRRLRERLWRSILPQNRMHALWQVS